MSTLEFRLEKLYVIAFLLKPQAATYYQPEAHGDCVYGLLSGKA
jgi:hypothetical protein